MEQDGLVRAEVGTSEKNRPARFYTLTPAESASWRKSRAWDRLTEGVRRVFSTPDPRGSRVLVPPPCSTCSARRSSRTTSIARWHFSLRKADDLEAQE